jgi:hypothetical protein
MAMEFGKSAGIARVLLPDGENHAGMGVLVGPRHVLTCAHVANTAIGRPPEATMKPTQELAVEFPMSRTREPRYGHVASWSPMGRTPEYDICVIELTEDAPADVGVAVLADIHVLLDGDPLSVYGSAARESNGHHIAAEFKGPCSNSEVQIDGVAAARGLFVKQGYSGAAVWDAKHSVVVGIVRAMYRGADIAYMVPTARIAEAWHDLPYETRRLPFLVNWLWTAFATVFLTLVIHFMWVVQAATPDQNPQLGAFVGMHLYFVGAALMGWLWYLHARNYRLHQWSARIPRFAGIDFGPDSSASRVLSIVSIVLFILIPLYTQGHFIRTFHTQGHVYIYSDDFGYSPPEVFGCLGRMGLCQHKDAGRYSTVTAKPPAVGGYWNNAYHYGDAQPKKETRPTATFFPILQPIAVILFTAAAIALQGFAAITSFSRRVFPKSSERPSSSS